MSRDTGFIKFSFLHFIGVFIGLNLKLNCELLGDFWYTVVSVKPEFSVSYEIIKNPHRNRKIIADK